MGCVDLTRDRVGWPAVVNAVMNGFHTRSRLLASLGRILLHRVSKLVN
jgi:hypothetical protein